MAEPNDKPKRGRPAGRGGDDAVGSAVADAVERLIDATPTKGGRHYGRYPGPEITRDLATDEAAASFNTGKVATAEFDRDLMNMNKKLIFRAEMAEAALGFLQNYAYATGGNTHNRISDRLAEHGLELTHDFRNGLQNSLLRHVHNLGTIETLALATQAGAHGKIAENITGLNETDALLRGLVREESATGRGMQRDESAIAANLIKFMDMITPVVLRRFGPEFLPALVAAVNQGLGGGLNRDTLVTVIQAVIEAVANKAAEDKG